MSDHRREQAVRLVVALQSTTLRYMKGFIVKTTWQRHMDHLWAKASELGVRDDVARMLSIR